MSADTVKVSQPGFPRALAQCRLYLTSEVAVPPHLSTGVTRLLRVSESHLPPAQRPLSRSMCFCKAFRTTLYFRLGDGFPGYAKNLTDPWLERANVTMNP